MLSCAIHHRSMSPDGFLNAHILRLCYLHERAWRLFNLMQSIGIRLETLDPVFIMFTGLTGSKDIALPCLSLYPALFWISQKLFVFALSETLSVPLFLPAVFVTEVVMWCSDAQGGKCARWVFLEHRSSTTTKGGTDAKCLYTTTGRTTKMHRVLLLIGNRDCVATSWRVWWRKTVD